jgi:plasmid stabilization system protein ParE
MKVIFDEDAQDDLRRILNWIAQDNSGSAERFIKRILDRIARLESPELVHMGRPGLVEGTPELLEGPYIIVYRVDEEAGEIVIGSVVHGARKRATM